MADVIDMKEYFSVRFFKESIVCGFCGQLTRARVYDSVQAIVCTECGGPMLELESDDVTSEMTIVFDPEAS